MKLLLDEMWRPEIATQLRARGHDVIAVAERSDLRGQPDEKIFAAAQTEFRAVVTENVADFRPLARLALGRGEPHSGLVLTSNRRFPRHELRTLGRIIAALAELLSSTLDLRNTEHWLE